MTETAAKHMHNPGRYVPLQLQEKAIRYGRRTPDPKKKPGLFRYETRMYKLVEDKRYKGSYFINNIDWKCWSEKKTELFTISITCLKRDKMVCINSGTRHFRLTPYERIPEPEEPSYDWINVWVEFSIPALKTEFETSFTVGELTILKDELATLYQSVREQKKNPVVIFNSMEKQLILNFHQSRLLDAVSIGLLIRPEDHADSVVLKDFFGIDESYFPALLSGLDEMINWQN